MSFLFKSKKNAQPPPSALPPATRNIHTSDGTLVSASGSLDRKGQSPPPAAGPNGSLNSLNGQVSQGPNASNDRAPFIRSRDRADSESGGNRPNNLRPAAPHADLYPWSQRQLTFQNSQANPFPRYGAAVNANASKDGDIYLMGGLINGSMVRGDLWMIEAGSANLSCYPISTVSEGPGPRVGHASLLVGNAFIVFGGDTKMDDSDVLDDTLYLLNTSSRQWSRASPPGPKPSGRYGHTLNILGSKIYIFGGQVEGTFYNDLVAFDLNALQNPSNQWEFVTPLANEGGRLSAPPARTNHSMISHNDQLFLFGGTDGNQWFNDVWTFDPKANRWTQQDCIGYIPAPREGHSAALVNDVMYVFGGRTEHGDDLGDLAAFRISLRRWYTFQNMGPSPSARSGHSMTSFGKQILVLAGEPSTAPRDPNELSMVYILDTAKIRYPNDAPPPQQRVEPISGVNRPPNEPQRAVVGPRSASREGNLPRNEPQARDLISGGPVQRPEPLQNRNAKQSTSPQVGHAQSTSPNQAPPNARQNGASPQPQAQVQVQNPRSKSPGQMNDVKSQKQSGEHTRQSPSDNGVQGGAVREINKEGVKSNRDPSPSSSHGRRTPTHQPISKVKAMEAGEAAPLVGGSVARSRSLRSQRGHGSMDSSEEGLLGRNTSRNLNEHRNSRTFAEEPNSPKITPHQEALIKELESVKNKNAWYASELALARKAGYAGSGSPTVDERATMQFSDDDRPLVEAFMTMRNELMKMQQSMEQQASITAKKIGEVEHQRDAAITEAAYARAKLAAHGGSQRSTPQLESTRESDEAERSTDISRRLALSLAATNEQKSKLEAVNEELSAERRAREAAEEAAETVQKRFDELSTRLNPGELEGLRAELHEAQSIARAEAGQRTEIEHKLRNLEVDHKDLQDKHNGINGQVSGHTASLAALEAALVASTSKTSLFERQLEEERGQREHLEAKLTQLRSEHEDRTRELETASRRLNEAETLADTHAKEAATHREALISGLAKISRPDSALARDSFTDERVSTAQEAAERATALAKTNQEAADLAAQKLRAAEERIAGLEAYQEQSSREGLQIRRQLQAALRDLKTHQSDNREMKTLLETHQRDASALAVQHGALKNLLGERGIDMSSTRRSPTSEQHGSRYGTPEMGRLRELEQQLQASQKSHDETKSMFESREQEAERAYRERLEQLENDYQSLLSYVKGTEKMLKKMKEELTKYKSQNQKLNTELEASKDGKRSVASSATDAADWASERDAMQISISEIKTQMTQQLQTLEANLSSVKSELAVAQDERDQQKASHEELSKSIQQRETELAQLKSENSMLETRALDAEHRVTMLLDQVGSSVNNYRRQSQLPSSHPNGISLGHLREPSASTVTDTSSIDDTEEDARGSLALDNLASELETLRSQWESQSRSYRLSDKFDFERTPTRDRGDSGPELSDSLASWRKKMDEDEEEEARTPNASKTVTHGSSSKV